MSLTALLSGVSCVQNTHIFITTSFGQPPGLTVNNSIFVFSCNLLHFLTYNHLKTWPTDRRQKQLNTKKFLWSSSIWRCRLTDHLRLTWGSMSRKTWIVWASPRIYSLGIGGDGISREQLANSDSPEKWCVLLLLLLLFYGDGQPKAKTWQNEKCVWLEVQQLNTYYRYQKSKMHWADH